MITLALDTATDRCTVAATDGTRELHAHVDGSRRHAAEIIGLIDGLLRELGARATDIGGIVLGDGPGSFTGLRVAAAVARGLTWRRTVWWRVAPSLLVRAAAHAPAGGGRVVAMSDALRGEVYAAAWDFSLAGVGLVGESPRAWSTDALLRWPRPDVMVGTVPQTVAEAIGRGSGREVIGGEAALPDARWLLWLANVAGGTMLVESPLTWQPDYGRPVEDQAVWERKYGRELPAAASIAR